jgi:hypothetical protein
MTVELFDYLLLGLVKRTSEKMVAGVVEVKKSNRRLLFFKVQIENGFNGEVIGKCKSTNLTRDTM